MIVESTLLIVGLSFIAGMIGAMVGLGGGFIIVPMLVILFGLPAQVATGTSLVSIIFTAISSSIGYAWQGIIDKKLATALALTTVPGAAIGAYSTQLVSSTQLQTLFGFFLIAVASYMAVRTKVRLQSYATASGWDRSIQSRSGVMYNFKVRNLGPGIALGSAAGFVSGFFGVGGGAIQVPLMVLGLSVPIHVAVATSSIIIVVTSISGGIVRYYLAHISQEFVMPIIIGVVVGAQAGVIVQKRLRGRMLEEIFALVLALFGIRLIIPSS